MNTKKWDLLKPRRMLIHGNPHATNSDQLWAIHSEGVYGCAPNRSQTRDFGAILVPGEMVGPCLTLRVKQGKDGLGGWIRGRLTAGLIAIARGTGQTQIVELGLSTN